METEKKLHKVLLVGGGSGGPVSPLLAVTEEIRERDPKVQFLLIGGYRGPERRMAEQETIPFTPIHSGKFRRYVTFRNFFAPLLVLIGFVQSLFIIARYKPSVAIGAGSYIQVPALWACKFLGVPILIHQQDFQKTLANSLCSIIASRITVSFKESEKLFPQGNGLHVSATPSKVLFTGNPIRSSVLYGDREVGYKHFSLVVNRPTLLVLGGGTGAEAINNLVKSILPHFRDVMQVLHAAGAGKLQPISDDQYHGYEFIERMDLAYAVADIVVTRAGLSTITELSKLGKISIIIPMPATHQEANAQYLLTKEAALVVDQRTISPEELTSLIRNLLLDRKTQQELVQNIKSIMPADATTLVTNELYAIAK